MILKQTATAIANQITASFGASGGTAPYVYSVVSGGPGGTIGASSGVYTAPAASVGVETIRVVDASSAEATATILVTDPLGLTCDIIRNYMALDSDQVFLWDQKFNIPKDSRLYVAVGIQSLKPFGVTNRFNFGANQDDQSVNMLARLDVNIMSRSLDAVKRKEEIVLALTSSYAQRQQTANSFYLSPLPGGFVNLSQEDGAAIPYRFAISVNLQYFFKKRKSSEYFDEFTLDPIETES